jgi:hypothetical protein
MHRLLKEAADYLRDLGRSAARAWCGLFFTPADPTPLGVIRVAVGALLFWSVAVLGVDLHDYLGSDGWIGPEAARGYLAVNSPRAWSFWLWVPDRWLTAAWAACLVVLALFTLGLGSRATAVLAWTISVSIVRRAPAAQFGFDQMVCTILFYLAAFGASGQAVSLDRFFSRLRLIRRDRIPVGPRRSPLIDAPAGAPSPSVSANLSLRMLQLHMVLIYGSAGLSKLMGPEWWNGTAMEMIVLTPEFRRFDFIWLFRYPAVLALSTHFGLLLELAYPVLIWVHKLRPLVIASVVGLHLGIDLILGLTEFELAMIVANLAFASGPWLRRLATGMNPSPALLLFAPRSLRAEAVAVLAMAADPDRLVRAADLETGADLVPADRRGAGSRDELLLLLPDGRTASGFDAVSILARRLPLFWPVGVLGGLPGLRAMLRAFDRAGAADGPGRRGPRVPARVAERSIPGQRLEPVAPGSARSLR